MTDDALQSQSRESFDFYDSDQDDSGELISSAFMGAVVSDCNLPFVSPNPCSFPASYANVCDALLPSKLYAHSAPVCSAGDAVLQVEASVFIFKSTVYVTVSFRAVCLRFSFTIKNSCDVRVSLIGVLFALVLSPDGDIELEVPRRYLLEQLNYLPRAVSHFQQSKHSFGNNIDILLAIYYEMQQGKRVNYYLGEGKRSRAAFQQCGVFYDHMRAKMACASVSSIKMREKYAEMQGATLDFVVGLGGDFRYIGTFSGSLDYEQYCEAIYPLSAGPRGSGADATLTDRIQVQIYDFDQVTHILIENREYSLRIYQSTRYRRLLIAVLLVGLRAPNNCCCEVLVNNPVLPAVVASFEQYIDQRPFCADMDVLLAISSLKQQHRRFLIVKELFEYKIAPTSMFLGDFVDWFNIAQLSATDVKNGASLQETSMSKTNNAADTSNTTDDTSTGVSTGVSLSQSCSEPHRRLPGRLSSELVRKQIQRCNFAFLQPKSATYTHSERIQGSGPASALRRAPVPRKGDLLDISVYVYNEEIQIHWPFGRWARMTLKLHNSTPVRRTLVGMLVAAIYTHDGSALQFRLPSDMLAGVYRSKAAFSGYSGNFSGDSGGGDILQALSAFNFTVNGKAQPIGNAVFIGEYFDCCEFT